jgi:uncharacterized membrane protein
MDERAFSIKDVLSEGWKLTKENLGFLLSYQIILYLLVFLFAGANGGWKWVPWHILGWIIVVLAKMGLYRSTLMIADGQKPGFDQLYQNWRLFLSWIVSNFLFGILFFLGLLLILIPGFYVWAKYGLFPFTILDKDVGPMQALKETGKISEGNLWPIFLLFLACTGLNIIGLLLFGIGLLLTIPVTLIALAAAYRKLNLKKQLLPQQEQIDFGPKY